MSDKFEDIADCPVHVKASRLLRDGNWKSDRRTRYDSLQLGARVSIVFLVAAASALTRHLSILVRRCK